MHIFSDGKNDRHHLLLFTIIITISRETRSQDFDQFDNYHKGSKDSVAKPAQNKQILKIGGSKTEFSGGTCF